MGIFDRSTQFRMRRAIRRRQRQFEEVTQAAEHQLERNFIGRFDRLWRVRRFVLGWIGLIVVLTLGTVLQSLELSNYYQTSKPVAGGIYNEGIVGTYSNADPLYAAGRVDQAVSHLIFAGLLKYDQHNQLVGDLASDYSVSANNKQYTVHLKPHLTWQDGQPLTSADVAFTYHLIQNPDTGSPLQSSWQGITIAAPDARTVVFTLHSVYAAFPYNLLTGIVPQHLLARTPAVDLRTASFNTTDPVGAGPFAWEALQTSPVTDPDKSLSLIELKPFAGYNDGAPKLSGYVVHAYGSEQPMVDAYRHRTLNAMAGLVDVPASLRSDSGTQDISFPSTAAVMTFFKTNDGVLADTQVRKALVQAVDTGSIIQHLGYPAAPVKEPFLLGQFAYDPKYAQAAYDPAAAAQVLSSDGWTQNGDQTRVKNGQPLTFHLYAEDTSENRRIVGELVDYWHRIGVDAVPELQQLTDFQTTLEFHTYDALLYGISIGTDPDVFSYWDSSQADIRSAARLNFSEYKNSTADNSLEAGRTRLDPQLRALKYKPFLQAWQNDAPALGLYQPRFLYITRGRVYGLDEHTLNTDSDRYYSVNQWEIHTAKVTNK